METLGTITNKVKKYKKLHKTVGLITGNFDVLHIGHTRLFTKSKEKVDILIVGVDCNKLANVYRKDQLPLVNTLDRRIEIIENLKTVDHTFPIRCRKNFTTLDEIDDFHTQLIQKVNPNYIITNPLGDFYYKQRKDRCKRVSIKLLELWDTSLLH